MGFVELAARSSFSFLRGASHPEEMIERAKAIGLDSIAICDRDGIYGAARAHARAREVEQNFHVGAEVPLALAEDELRAGYAGTSSGILNEAQCRQLLPGAKPNALRRRMLLEDGYPSLIFLVKNRQGYQNLCWLLTRAHADMPKGECLLDPSDLTGHVDGLIALIPTQLIRACLDLTQLTRMPLPQPEAEQIRLDRAEASPVLEKAQPLASVPSQWAEPRRQNAGREVPCDAFPGRLLARLCDLFGAGTGIYSITHRRLNHDDVVRAAVANARQRRHGLPVLASARPVYHDKERQRLSDVMQCIRLGTTLSQAKTKISSNAQAYLRSASQMRRLFRDQPEWIERTGAVASELQFKLGELHYYFPCQTPAGETPDEYLKQLSGKGARWRYPGGVPEKVKQQIDNELRLIQRMEVAPYFLSTWEVVEMARSRGILCQGRGSAANSAVCYVLGITAVNPDCSNLLFERFMSEERKEPPDIDVDFEHERREEVIQEIYSRYGQERAAMVSEVICYRRKSALRDVSKVFGLSLDQSDRLVRTFSHWDDFSKEDAGNSGSASLRQRLKEAGLDDNASKVRGILLMAQELSGFPRHLSIHVGGFVLSSRPLFEVSPVEPARMEDRSVVPWDKDDLDILGFFKIDVLALGMLTAIRKAMQLAWADGGLRGAPIEPCGAASMAAPANQAQADFVEPARNYAAKFDPLEAITHIPDEDPAVYALTSRADTVGVFQIESRAQMAMLPRLRPRCFYDLVIEVAIVRPGPIQGGMIHPYLRRRNREEAPDCHPSLTSILARTLGVPLFQEQVMQIAIVGAGYSGGEADQLRRDMAAWKKSGRLLRHRKRLLDGFARSGIDRRFGEALFEQIKGFGEYGFPESHAASFALLVYKSAWLKAHYPAHFLCALLNSQPMGFYSPSSLVRDAQQHGVEVRPACVVSSEWDCSLEEPGEVSKISSAQPGAARAVRLGLRMIKGLARANAERLLERRRTLHARGAHFEDLQEFARHVQLPKGDIEALAEAGAFQPLEAERRQALWSARAPKQMGLFQGIRVSEPRVELPPLQAIEVLALDYGRVRLSIDDHPLRHLRDELSERAVLPIERLLLRAAGERVAIAGLVTARQRPGTASGVVFVTLEDETGIANLVFYSRVFEEYRSAAQHSPLMLVRGHVERQDPKPGSIDRSDPRQANGVAAIIHVIVESAERLVLPGPRLSHTSRDFR